MAALSTTSTLQSGAPVVFLLPAGTSQPAASAVSVQMSPASGSGNSYTLSITNVAPGSSGGFLLMTAIPVLPITATTSYTFIANGTSPAFTTTPFTASVTPGAALQPISPAAGQAGTSLTVTLVGSGTSWASGSTTASFGAGISVGGASPGQSGPVSVTSPTQATAQLVISPSATTGTRDVTVTTGTQSLTLPAAFTVTAAAPLPSVGGPYTGTAGTAITFSGAGSSDPGGLSLSYAWDFGDGSSATGVAPSHAYTKSGTYTVALSVTNSAGISSTAKTTATIAAAPQPPVANAGGPYTGTAGTAVAFSGAGSSDPKGETLSYSWTFGDSGTATGISPSHTYSTAGTYNVTLTVTNTDSLSASVTTTATVKAAPQPPVANAGGPYTGTASTAIVFSGAGSTDPKGETLSYSWSFGDSGTATGVNPSHTYTTAGTYNVTLTVTNTDSQTASSSTTATVKAAPQSPVANAGGPYSGTAGTAITLSGAGSSDPKGETLSYAWNFGDGTSGTGVAPSHTYASAGSYTVTLMVTNTDALTASATTTATIKAAPQPPVANAGGPYTGTAGTAIAFSGSGSSDPKNETLSYSWSFGDGGTATGVGPSHTYTAPGSFTVTLTVTNTDSLTSIATTTATVKAAPQPPVANAGGPYSGTADAAVAFNGSSSSDPKGETLTYAWSFGDGSSATGVSPSHTYASAGTYTVTLTVTNTDSLSASATATATIVAAPQAPTANAGGPYTGTAGTAVVFNGSGSSDPKGETLTYAWDFGDNSTGSGANPAHSYSAGGTFTVKLTVTNTDQLSATATTTATVSAAPQAPTVSAGGPYSGTAGVAVSFTATASDPKNETLTVTWNFGDGNTGNGLSVTHVYATAGTYTATVTATNTDKLSASATASVTIAAAPQAPVANAGGPYNGTAGTGITLDGSGSTDPKAEALSYAWNFGDSTTGTGVKPTHTYAAAGSYTATLTVTNTDNLTSSATAAVTIASAPQAPTANAGGPYTGTVGVSVSFNASGSSDPQGQTLTYAWNFGDGSSASGVSPVHAFAAAGTFTVTLTVSDTSGLSSQATTTVVISSPAAQPPVANPGGPYSGTVGTAVTFNGSGSSDPKNESLTYQWSFGDGATASGAAPSHTYVSGGSYQVTLTVTNTDGATGSATTTASVTAPSILVPVVYAGGPYNGVTGVAVAFDATNSYDPNNSAAAAAAVTLTWSFGDGSAPATGAQPIHVYAATGTYTVTVTGTASGGTASATSSAVITAGASTIGAPTAVATGPSSAVLNTAVSFDGSTSTDPNGLALTYLWVFGDGSSSTDASPTHSFAVPGSFNVVLTVSNGATLGYASTPIKVAAPATSNAVQANAGGPYTVAVNQVLHLDGTKTTDPSAHLLTYNWDFGDGTTATGAAPTHIYSATGSYKVNLNVLDGTTASSNSTATATVTGPPAETLTANAGGPYTESTGIAIVLDGSGSIDNLNLPLTYTWDFGDGSSGSGITPSHTYSSPGTFTATLTASSGSVTATATAKVSIAQAIAVTISSPTANALFGANATASVTGTLNASGLSVNVNGVAAQVSGTNFTATGVSLREGVNLLVATAVDGKGGVGTGSVSVDMDATAPTVSFTTPAANAVLSTTQTAVTGLINDIVTGTIGSNDVTVMVNGQPAQVSNRSYLLPSLALVPGVNTLTVVATDRVGNVGTTTETVSVLPASAQLSLRVVSGDAQSAAVHTLLAKPLVVQLLSSAGSPIAGRPVTFAVTRSDGMVEAMPTTAQSVSVTTDATGSASVLFQLGSRSGLGVNQVTATTPGAAGAAVFTASTTVGAATQIHIVRGDSQRGLLSAALPEAFQTIVQDQYGNPVSGANVTFTNLLGGGTLDNTTVLSDSNGKASATLTLGQQEGIGNYTVQADIVGDTGSPVVFRASGYAAGPVANTSVSGVVLDNSNTPVMNATVTLANTGLSTTSDVNGKFLISGAPIGTVTLTVDGSTATSSHTLPFLSFVLIDLPGQNNSLTKPIYLPFIDVDDAQTVGGTDPVTLTIAGVPGVAFTIPANAVTFPDGSKVGKMSLSQVKSDMVPMLPSNGTSPNLVWTLQPAGARFSQPVQVTLPNTQALPPGTVSEFYQYDHDLEQFVSAGTMHVSADGSVMVSDAGFGITKAGWGHGPVVPNPNTCVVSVQSTTCETVASGNCGTTITYKDNAACGNEPTDQCHQRGVCQKGACIARWKPDGAPCTGPLFCSDYQCKSAACAGTPIADQDVPNDPTALAPALQIESAFTAFGEKVKDFFGNYGGGVELAPYFSAPSQSEKSTCCEAKKQNGLLVETLSLGGGLNVQSPDFTVIVGGVPLGISFPTPVGTEGLTLQVKGGIGVTAVYETNQCTDHKCWGGGPVISIGVEGKLRFGVTQFNVYGTIGGSITGTAIINCDRVTASLTWSGVELKGGVQVGPIAFPYPAATYIGPATIFMRYDLNTGQINYGVQ